MSSVKTVPELAAHEGVELTIKDAALTFRRYGLWPLVRESFVRFRYGDGFSHSRALGLQLALATVPLVIAAVGAANVLANETAGVVLRATILELSPGASDTLVTDTLLPYTDEEGDEAAILLGGIAAFLALTSAMGQLERGANRIYGIQRDRPSLPKYTRAFVLAVLAGLPAMIGFAVLVAAEAFAESVELYSGPDDDWVVWSVRAGGAVLLLAATTLMLRYAPARAQPGWSMLAVGAAVALGLWVTLTALLAGYLHLSAGEGSVYGPLTGVMALLVWAQLTAAAILLAMAVSAELEGARVGRLEAAEAEESEREPTTQEKAALRTGERGGEGR